MLFHPEKVDRLTPSSGLTIYHVGPSFQKGPLPSLFYFALSGEDSLTLDPYNQPVSFFQHQDVRIFSFSLPFHGEGFENKKAMAAWALEIKKNPHFFENFISKSLSNIDFLIHQGYVDSKNIAVAGLSRGGFIATHLAAHDKRISTILGYAPLTQLGLLEEFQDFQKNPLIQSLDLSQLADKLCGRHLRFYIGNRDTRVGTEECFQFIKTLVESSYQKGYRSPPVELILSPSVGHKGHGTLPHIFQNGALWIKERWGIQNSLGA